jgi:3-isopropylmalate/(R)-2-methylmalate dehydratase small subunit
MTDLFFKKALSESGLKLTIDLENQLIIDDNEKYNFKVDVFKKYCLIQGLDDISLTLENKEDIKGFEIKYYNQYPWLK